MFQEQTERTKTSELRVKAERLKKMTRWNVKSLSDEKKGGIKEWKEIRFYLLSLCASSDMDLDIMSSTHAAHTCFFKRQLLQQNLPTLRTFFYIVEKTVYPLKKKQNLIIRK